MYDHNQILVPESFLALYVRNGRLTSSRAEIEQRSEFAEELAQHIAAMPATAAAEGPAEQAQSLDRCRSGLLSAPSQVSEAEAGWIVRRVAELLEWEY